MKIHEREGYLQAEEDCGCWVGGGTTQICDAHQLKDATEASLKAWSDWKNS